MNAKCIASAALALACAFHAFARVDVKIDLHRNADGMRDVGHANFLGRNNKRDEGRNFIKELRACPTDKRNVEERQSVDIAEYAFLRHDMKANRARCVECLKAAYDAAPSSFWGWAAYTFLKDLGVDVPAPPKDPLRGLGKFGDGVVNLVPKRLEPDVSGRVSAFNRFMAATNAVAIADISALRPGSPVRRTILRKRLVETCGRDAIERVLRSKGGAGLFALLWNDDAVLEDFLLSGPVFNAPLALETLMTLFLNDEKEGWTKTSMGRRATVAVAINAKAGDDMTATVRHWAAYRRIGMMDRFVKSTKTRDCREWRFIVRRPIDPADTLYLNTTRRFPTRLKRNVGLKGVPYRKKNCFGTSKWAKNDAFLRPWLASGWPRQYLRSRVGGVCTEQAMWAALCANAHGIMAERAGQPGHCCWLMRGDDGNWTIIAGIRPYTAGVFLLWGHGIQYIQSTERAFRDRDRHDVSELLRFTGRVREAALHCPYNYPAWRAYADMLKAKGASVDAWSKYLGELVDGTPDGRLVSWDLANEAIGEMAAKGADVKTIARETARVFKGLPQPKAWIAEEMNYKRDAIKRFIGRLGKNDELAMKVIAIALEANKDSAKYMPQIFGYALERWSKDKAKLGRFFEIAAKYAGGTDGKMNWRRLSTMKGCLDDRATFRMMAAFRNADDPPKGTAKVASSDYGSRLVSDSALVMVSSSGNGDTPEDYARVSDATPYDPNRGGLFATRAEDAQNVVVKLAGAVVAKGVTVVGADKDVVVWLADEDGKWREAGGGVFSDGTLRVDLRGGSQTVDSVKVGYRSGSGKKALILKKVLVYGDKLY